MKSWNVKKLITKNSISYCFIKEGDEADKSHLLFDHPFWKGNETIQKGITKISIDIGKVSKDPSATFIRVNAQVKDFETYQRIIQTGSKYSLKEYPQEKRTQYFTSWHNGGIATWEAIVRKSVYNRENIQNNQLCAASALEALAILVQTEKDIKEIIEYMDREIYLNSLQNQCLKFIKRELGFFKEKVKILPDNLMELIYFSEEERRVLTDLAKLNYKFILSRIDHNKLQVNFQSSDVLLKQATNVNTLVAMLHNWLKSMQYGDRVMIMGSEKELAWTIQSKTSEIIDEIIEWFVHITDLTSSQSMQLRPSFFTSLNSTNIFNTEKVIVEQINCSLQ